MSPDLPPVTVTSPPDATRTGPGVPPPSPGPPPDAPPGFTLDREIGSGGMGVVYLARQQRLNRPVALKTVRPGTTLDPRALIRFLAEAEAIASIRHPNVVEVYSFGEHAGRPYLALEYCPGGDLSAVSKADQTRDANWFRKVAELVAKIADGVNAAHAQGIVHRDLKPANVLLAADGTPKVTDFGLAKRGLGSDLTQTTDVLGTPAYMGPEQASGRTKFVGPEADVWALGVILFELLSGTRPFDAPTPLQIMAAVAKADVPKLRDRFPAVPPDLALVTHKCLSPDPRDRYPTAGPLATDLRNWLDGKPVTARPAGAIESAVKWVKRNKRAALTGAGVLLTMATATGVSLAFGIDATEQRKQAKAEAERAEEEKQAAIEAKNDLAKANEKTERALAKATVARYMSVNSAFGWGDTEDRINVAWELVEQRPTPFAMLVLDEAVSFQAPNTSLSVEFLHALVGLDAKQKAAVDRLLITALRNRSLPAINRTRVAEGATRAGYCTSWPTELTDAVRDGFQPNQLNGPSGTSTTLVSLANCSDLLPGRCDELSDLAITFFDGPNSSFHNFDEDYLALSRLWAGVSPDRRALYTAKILEVLLKKLENSDQYETGSVGRSILILGSAEFPHQAEELSLRVFKKVRDEFNSSKTPANRLNIANQISQLIDRLYGMQAAQLAELVVPPLLAEAENDDQPFNYAIYSLAPLCRWLPKEKRRQSQQQVIEMLSARFKKQKDPFLRSQLLYPVVDAFQETDPARAEQVMRELLDVATTPEERRTLELGIIRFGPAPATPDRATRMAHQLSEQGFASSIPDDSSHTFEALCLGLTREELHRRKAFPAVASGVTAESLPKPKPLPPQVLVDLLKRPFVVREKQRAVLNALEVTYDRKFKDVWAFVAFAEKEHPELDLLTPPKRPEKALPKADAKPK